MLICSLDFECVWLRVRDVFFFFSFHLFACFQILFFLPHAVFIFLFLQLILSGFSRLNVEFLIEKFKFKRLIYAILYSYFMSIERMKYVILLKVKLQLVP